MMRRIPLLTAVFGLVAAAGCALRGQSYGNLNKFVGDWVYQESSGPVPPYDIVTKIALDDGRLVLTSHWGGPPSAPQGLTFIGVVTPRIALDLSGREAGSQVGPFVVRHTTEWRNDELVTRWSTSEYMGSAYSGVWGRSVSRDGSTMSLEIYALSSIGSVSRARMIFRRK